ncbi:hypothetical protein [Streptomyces fuscichromogenes]|uniref:Uncharacterized protein n=1 Tax=Streptomyces fuscichromogenes TaxID=1324013 RepID=A0A917XMY6_9ACTN|nr:hypothetical protein [Streptomyces fuscichromogenes]GGN42393.1 hypothetical protein GCM10011578_091680 [Streptomyces fuscichromogenes]
MDAEAPDFRLDLELFLEDIALSFDTHGGRSAAVVWPQGEASVVQALVDAHGRSEVPVGDTAHVVARKFGELVNRQVCVAYRTVRAGDADEERHIAADVFVVMLQGVVEVRLAPLGTRWPARVGQFQHRLLAGEVLYIPAGFSCAVFGQRSVALLMELVLDD